MNAKDLSKRETIIEVDALKAKLNSLNLEKSTLLKIAQDSFLLSSDSHLKSLNPDMREKLGLESAHLTQSDPTLQKRYTDLKNKYLSLGKSYASISFLFDLVENQFTPLDLIVLHEILMGDGEFRKDEVYIERLDGSKIVFKAENILHQLEEIFLWYKSTLNQNISPIVIAVIFHFKLLSIHPFLDGNGRISRLVLNLILLKDGLFPVSVPDEKRKDYYEVLTQADDGNFEKLVDFWAKLESEKINQYLTIAKELEDLDFSKELLVLTEDGNTDMMEKLISIHGIDINKTKIESYDGKDNLAAAIFFAKKLISKSKTLKHILIHRDRDNENPQQLKSVIEKYLRNNLLESISTVLVTTNYDIEGYFLNRNHINELFPSISVIRAIELIEQATDDTKEVSKGKLRIAYSEYGKYGKMVDPQEKANALNALYDEDPTKYRYGKAVLFRLEELITKELNLVGRITLVQFSSFIDIAEIRKCKVALTK